MWLPQGHLCVAAALWLTFVRVHGRPPHQYWTFTRWGRVGVPGQQALAGPFGSADAALSVFYSKFNTKTKNSWQNRANFVKYAGKYQLIEMNYGTDDEDESKTESKKKGKGKGKKKVEVPKSKLPKSLQEFISLICNVDMMKKQMVEIGCVAPHHTATHASQSVVLTQPRLAALPRAVDWLPAGTTRRRCLLASCHSPRSSPGTRFALPHNGARHVVAPTRCVSLWWCCATEQVLTRIADVLKGESREDLSELSSEFYTVRS